MKKISILFLAFLVCACAKISVETKEPIKVDINMRVDVYQHVVKDIDSINDEIYGEDEKELNFLFGLQSVYAETLNPMKDAIKRRKARAKDVKGYSAKGYIGENRKAYLQMLESAPSDLKSKIKSLIKEENADRKVIYEAIAEKNNTGVSGVQEISFKDDYKRAPSGYWFEAMQGGAYEWIQK